MKDKQTKDFYDFADFRLDAENGLLWRDGKTVPLTPKEFELLLIFLENAGRVLGKDKLLEAVWSDTFVEESTLARNISWLRKKLETGDGKVIETVPKRGYRFTPAVVKTDAAAIVLEEQTLTHITIEETISLPDVQDEEMRGQRDAKMKTAVLPALPASTHSRISASPRLLLAFGALALAVIGFIVYQIFFARQTVNYSLAASVVPFSGAPGRENTPAFSPDSRQIAFSWNGGDLEKSDIYVRLLDAGEPVRLTDTPDIHEHYPTFSPDGSHIAFVREYKDYGEVILIPALGGAERRVARLFSGNYSISFAPNGEEIAVVDTFDSAPDKPHLIYLIDLKTGERRRRLTADDESGFLGETTPRFSPDGKTLAFVRVFPGYTHDLFVVSTNGGKQAEQLTFDRKVIHSLAWSAGGQEIFFVSTRESNRPNVWQISASGSESQIVATGGSQITNLAASPDGRRIAFVENTTNSDILRLSENAAAVSRFISSTFNEDSPQFSPDDSRVVFCSNRSGKNNEAWLADANGKNLRQLTDSEFAVATPRFSPDGTRIVYEARFGDKSRLFVAKVEGGEPVALTSGEWRDSFPQWSADARFIYFSSDRAGERNIFRIAADGTGEIRRITRGGGYVPAPAPDGKWIYYTKNADAPGLWRVPADGGAGAADEKSVPELADAGFRYTWTAAANGIFYIARSEQSQNKIKFYDFSTGKTVEIAADNGRLSPPESVGFAVSSDGKTILYAQRNQNSTVMLAELQK